MKLSIKDIRLTMLYVAIAMFMACQQPGGNSTGSEYMPEMGHSIAYEANYYNYYYYNTWGSQDEYYEYAKPREPVAGTIARGYAGSSAPSDDGITPNGSVPYYYGDTEEERTRAMTEIIDNPYHITDEGLDHAKELYNVYCGICHGEKGDGVGYLVRDDGGVYPVQPANFLLEDFVNASNGRYYHSIMFGKNLMGSYKDKLSYEERWQVIHYIRSLQAKELKLEYNQLVNTLNAIDIPAGEMALEENEGDHYEEGESNEDHGAEGNEEDHHSDSDH